MVERGYATFGSDLPSVDDCWNRIGVRGDRSCPKLAEHIHCRNCPVHAAAASACWTVTRWAAKVRSWRLSNPPKWPSKRAART